MKISCIILTRNEELHIRRSIRSAKRVSDVVHVIDSQSSDQTRAIALAEGAVVHIGAFASFAEKLNWAIENIQTQTDWTMRLDADEILSDKLVEHLPGFLQGQTAATTGIFVRRRLWFMGRPMRFGGVYPRLTLRLWRPHSVRCEDRLLDEHMLIAGQTANLDADIEDIPLSGLAQWISKHNEYSSLEARMSFERVGHAGETQLRSNLVGNSQQRTRWLKENIFYNLPPFVRPLGYYIYRYVLRAGFLDGWQGLIFHFLHGFWYRFLVDAKILEMRQARGELSDEFSTAMDQVGEM